MKTAVKPAVTVQMYVKTAVTVPTVSVTTASAKTATSAVTVRWSAATETAVKDVRTFATAAAMPAAIVKSSAKAAMHYVKTVLPMTPAGVKNAASAVTAWLPATTSTDANSVL